MWYRTLLTIPSQGQKLLASTSGADHDAEVCKNRFTQTSGNRRGAAPTITQKVTLLASIVQRFWGLVTDCAGACF